MKQVLAVISLLVLGSAAWYLGNRLSSDALGLAVGLAFGVLAGIPSALLVLAANRRRPARDEEDDGNEGDDWQRRPQGTQAFPYQPPVIVVAGGTQPQQWPAQPQQQPQYPGRRELPGPGAAPQQRSERVFRVVGEKEEWLDEW